MQSLSFWTQTFLSELSWGIAVLELLETCEDAVAFYTPAKCFDEAAVSIPSIAERRNLDSSRVLQALAELKSLVEPIDPEFYSAHEQVARRRIRSRDEADWPVVATAIVLNCPIWTEDRDFFGIGIATWTTATVEQYLQSA